MHRMYPKNGDIQAYANSVDSGQMSQNAVSDRVYTFSHLSSSFLDITGSKMYLAKL